MNPVIIGKNMVRGVLAGYPFFYHLLKSILSSRSSPCLDQEALEKEAAYAFQVAEHYLGHLSVFKTSILGKRVVELGPGRNLGTSLILACHGVEIMAVEPHEIPWDPDYHPRFYAALKDWTALNRPSLSLAPLERVVAEGRIPKEVIEYRQGSLEDFPVFESGSVDIVFSNAVLEHVLDLKATLGELSRITRP